MTILQKFENLCERLQSQDRDKGYSRYIYTRSYSVITKGHLNHKSQFAFADGTVGYLSLTDILDDGLNLDLITETEYYEIERYFLTLFPNPS